MLNFFYDSLDTLKKVKKPSNKEVTNLTLIIFAVVIIAALLFALLDGVFWEVYNMIYETLKWAFWSGVPIDAYPTDLWAPIDVVPAEAAPAIDVDALGADVQVVEPTVEAEPVADIVEPTVEWAGEGVVE